MKGTKRSQASNNALDLPCAFRCFFVSQQVNLRTVMCTVSWSRNSLVLNPVRGPLLQEALSLRSGLRDVFVQEIKYKLSTTPKCTRPTKSVWEWDERINEVFLAVFSSDAIFNAEQNHFRIYFEETWARCIRSVYNGLPYLSDLCINSA